MDKIQIVSSLIILGSLLILGVCYLLIRKDNNEDRYACIVIPIGILGMIGLLLGTGNLFIETIIRIVGP